MIYKIFASIILILLIISCVVQYDDPDPLLWIAAYGFVAVLTALSILGMETPLPIPALILYGIWFVTLAPRELGPWLEIETARESGGLLFAILWLIALTIRWVRRKPAIQAELE